VRVVFCVSARLSSLLRGRNAKGGCVKSGQITTTCLACLNLFRSPSEGSGPRPRPLGCSVRQMAPSRQERRKALRAAAKRASASAGASGAAGAAGAAAALANLNVNPVPGDWTTQEADVVLEALGRDTRKLRRMAAEGDMGAQFSIGMIMMGSAENGDYNKVGASGSSPLADVGFAQPPMLMFPSLRLRSDVCTWWYKIEGSPDEMSM